MILSSKMMRFYVYVWPKLIRFIGWNIFHESMKFQTFCKMNNTLAVLFWDIVRNSMKNIHTEYFNWNFKIDQGFKMHRHSGYPNTFTWMNFSVAFYSPGKKFSAHSVWHDATDSTIALNCEKKMKHIANALYLY